MLELRPNCEYCDIDLPPDSSEARICSYECTFCAECVSSKLENVCPNCGGGFEARPIRPRTARRPGVSLGDQPGSITRVGLKHDPEAISAFVAKVRDIDPRAR